jgi:hypothetical protein
VNAVRRRPGTTKNDGKGSVAARASQARCAPTAPARRKIRIGDASRHGYYLDAFTDAFELCRPRTRQVEQPEHRLRQAKNPTCRKWNTTVIPDREGAANPHSNAVVPVFRMRARKGRTSCLTPTSRGSPHAAGLKAVDPDESLPRDDRPGLHGRGGRHA